MVTDKVLKIRWSDSHGASSAVSAAEPDRPQAFVLYQSTDGLLGKVQDLRGVRDSVEGLQLLHRAILANARVTSPTVLSTVGEVNVAAVYGEAAAIFKVELPFWSTSLTVGPRRGAGAVRGSLSDQG
jgi:hypothetical protein